MSAASRAGGNPDFDGIRRKYVAQLHQLTGRPVVIYYANFMNATLPNTSIILGDMQGMMEVLRDLPAPAIDLVIHSPGGSAEAAESIVHYLRTKFQDIRVFVPLAAMSAATMWALSADRIVMGKHSQLGPIDPQIMITSPAGVPTFMPARAIIDQFERAKNELAANKAFLAAWTPLLQQYTPGLLALCQTTEELAKRLVSNWLESYMLRNDLQKREKAQGIADFFADASTHQSHGLGIHRETARSHDVIVDDLEADQQLQDAVLSVHHSAIITLNVGTLKIIENNLGRGFYTTSVQVAQPPQPQAPPPSSPGAASPPSP